MSDYTLGTLVRVSATWTVSGTPTDPSTVVLRYIHEGQNGEMVDTYLGPGSLIVRDSAGTFHADIDPDGLGDWRYRWEGGGAAKAAADGEFRVISSYHAGVG